MTPPAALRRLLAGNRRYLSGRTEADRGVDQARRAAPSQAPYALVITCVDSRLPVETIFDQGFGDVCVLRTAGHVLDTSVTGSVDLSVAVLGVSLVLVLGHERCGAVGYAMEHAGSASGDLGYLVDQIAPAIEEVDREGADGPVRHGLGADRYDRIMCRHVTRTVSQLAAVPSVRDGLADGSVGLLGARYDLTRAQVRLIG
ncbi:carbonic anhydrase [Actinocatenispora thailandica]|uniref:Carbonic anhydrase n=1 Tax=Actinocatenispora thailandica TaxID=227318 RepID=A0A7R7HW32_9ACTN|nr:carbonic anhydrase [Actinocatenispora thailandica]